MAITYKDAGVDIEKGDALVSKIKAKVQSTYGKRVKEGVGGFSCLYEIGNGKLLAAGTDGVGTKLKLAQILDKHDTIGIDLVAMCVNDILCTGAKSLFFMDYLATAKLDVNVSEQIIDGVVEGCKQAGAALIGGETAEMPGMYQNGDYDLAGFAVGEVMEKDLIDGKKVKEGDTLFGIASSGFHSNGYSLVRKLIKEDETELVEKCLTPTRIYCSLVDEILEDQKEFITGMAHVTGGGFTNIARMNKNFNYMIENPPKMDEIPEVFKMAQERSELPANELYRTFNMGVGFVIATSNPEKLHNILTKKGEKFWTLGQVVKGNGKVEFKSSEFDFTLD